MSENENNIENTDNKNIKEDNIEKNEIKEIKLEDTN